MGRLREPQRAVALELVGRIHEAAAGSALWPWFLEGFAAATHSESTAISFLSHVRTAPDVVKSYLEHFTYVNPLLGSLDAAAEGQVVSSDSVMPRAAFNRTEYYADWLRPQGARDVVVVRLETRPA